MSLQPQLTLPVGCNFTEVPDFISECWSDPIPTVEEELSSAECEIRDLLWLKSAGLTYTEIKIYQAKESTMYEENVKDPVYLEDKMKTIYNKMLAYANSSTREDEFVTQSAKVEPEDLYMAYQSPTLYPDGHPLNWYRELEIDIYGRLSADIQPITNGKRMLRRFERKKNRIEEHNKHVFLAERALLDIAIPKDRKRRLSNLTIENIFEHDFPCGDALNKDHVPKDCYICFNLNQPRRNRNDYHPGQRSFNEHPENWRNRKNEKIGNIPMGPKKKPRFAVEGYDVVRLDNDEPEPDLPIEEQMLEGTKMSLERIRQIDRFKDYSPGVPSRVLFLKNIAPEVSQAQVSLLFNQFILANGGPIDVHLITAGPMRGQAFVEFQDEDICIQALVEANGTILSGQPIIAQFGTTAYRRPPDDFR